MNLQTVKPKARPPRGDSPVWHVSGDGRGCIGKTLDAALSRWHRCGLQLMGCERQTILSGLPRSPQAML